MLLSNTLFLQTVWRYSVLRAALGATPAPLVVVAIVRPASRLPAGIGHRPVLLADALVWAAGAILFVRFIGSSPEWASPETDRFSSRRNRVILAA